MSNIDMAPLDLRAWSHWSRRVITVGHFPYKPLCRNCRRHAISDRFTRSGLCRPCRRDAYMMAYNRHPQVKARKRAWDREQRVREKETAGAR